MGLVCPSLRSYFRHSGQIYKSRGVNLGIAQSMSDNNVTNRYTAYSHF